MIGDVYNTTVNINGNRVFSSTFYPGNCCCMGGMYNMNSCFGFGFGGFESGLGMGLGFAAGLALVPAMPAIFKGIGNAAGWFGTKVIAPAATAAWKGICWTGQKIGQGAAWFAKKTGITKLWNKIFHKKSESKPEKS